MRYIRGVDRVMSTRQRQLSFLKDLILQSDREESRRLMRRICQAEQQEKSSRWWTIWIASGIGGLLATVGLTTQGWGWVLRQSEHPLAVAVLWVGGVAVFGLLLVGGCWLWHRSALKGLVGDTQRFLAGWLASRDHMVCSTSRIKARMRSGRSAASSFCRSGAARSNRLMRARIWRCWVTLVVTRRKKS
jgi:hypothetical protein